MTRVLPGVYASIYDLSGLPEGESNLTAGFVLRANRGPVNEASLVTNSTSFLNRYTFKGYPTTKDDPTFWTILRTLAQTNQVYVSRVSRGALYGGIVISKDEKLGDITSITSVQDPSFAKNWINKITVPYSATNPTVVAKDVVRFAGTGKINENSGIALDGAYEVLKVENTPTENPTSTEITVGYMMQEDKETKQLYSQPLPETYTYQANDPTVPLYLKSKPQPFKNIQLGNKVTANTASTSAGSADGTFTVGFTSGKGEVNANYFLTGDRFKLLDYTNVSASTDEPVDLGTYTVVKAEEATTNSSNVKVTVKEDVTAIEGLNNKIIKVFRESIAEPSAYKFNSSNELFVVTGADPGAYNGDIELSIISTVESPDLLGEDPKTGAFQISVSDASSGVELEQPWLVSRIEGSKTIDGVGLYIEEVINENSSYIQVKNNVDADEEYAPSDISVARLSGGFDGATKAELDTPDYTRALQCFSDKTISVSVMGNGECEKKEFQTELVALADDRLDCIAFINSRYEDETATDPDARVNKIVNYKKELGTKWCATMYAPHVYINDVFNSRQVRIGADGVAIPGWLKVIRESGYPYAFAGPSDGLVTGVTCKWKIGDMSGQAETLNDNSINFIAFDAKVGRYYMQCQNTLQVANSALRNVGTVFNILNIKETFVTYFKEYLQKPITNSLRKQILDQGRNYMQTVMDANRVTNFTFSDVTTNVDLSNNTLRYLLVIAPTPYAQKIYLTMNIVNQTYDFSISQGGEV